MIITSSLASSLSSPIEPCSVALKLSMCGALIDSIVLILECLMFAAAFLSFIPSGSKDTSSSGCSVDVVNIFLSDLDGNGA